MDAELDDAFDQHAGAIRSHVNKLGSRHDAIRVQKWLSVLSEPMRQTVWKRNRNLHSVALLDMLQRGRVQPPFTSLPPATLQNFPRSSLPLHCSMTMERGRKNSFSPERGRKSSFSPPSSRSGWHEGVSRSGNNNIPSSEERGRKKGMVGEQRRSKSARIVRNGRGLMTETEASKWRRVEVLRERQSRIASRDFEEDESFNGPGNMDPLTLECMEGMSRAELVARLIKEQTLRKRYEEMLRAPEAAWPEARARSSHSSGRVTHHSSGVAPSSTDMHSSSRTPRANVGGGGGTNGQVDGIKEGEQRGSLPSEPSKSLRGDKHGYSDLYRVGRIGPEQARRRAGAGSEGVGTGSSLRTSDGGGGSRGQGYTRYSRGWEEGRGEVGAGFARRAAGGWAVGSEEEILSFLDEFEQDILNITSENLGRRF